MEINCLGEIKYLLLLIHEDFFHHMKEKSFKGVSQESFPDMLCYLVN